MLFKKKSNSLITILVVTVLIIFTIQLLRSGLDSDPDTSAILTDPELIEGKRLSEIYCASCHTHPNPGLLPKNTWEHDVLPEMGPLLGIFEHNGLHYNYIQNRSQLRFLPPDYYPTEPLLSSEEWQKIIDYYLYVAPDVLESPHKEPAIITDSLFFKARVPAYRADRTPNVAMVKFDPENRVIFAGESTTTGILVFDEELALMHAIDVPSLAVDIGFYDTGSAEDSRKMHITSIGSFEPNDEPLGSVMLGWYHPETGEYIPDEAFSVDNLTRPVQSRFSDLTGNGYDDLLIAEFGHRTGNLFWLEHTGDGYATKRNILIDEPGCIQTHVADYTGNGLPDIAALCTQADQSIYLLENQGSGKFTTRKLLQFDVTAGSSSFQLVDMNENGHPDILYTSGDNADFSQIYKPYHGVTIFLNDGDFNFTREWFYPINGAYRAVADDFTKNGQPDIAAIAYFADYYRHPEESFIFFKNEGGLTFTPYHHPAAVAGRWLTMDVADWTGNGYPDILLGSFPGGPATPASIHQPSWENAPPFLLLENGFDGLDW